MSGAESAAPVEGSEVEESLRASVRRLERDLKRARSHGARATRDLHATMRRDLKDARQRAKRAEARAQRAEDELAAVRASATWRAGRAVVAVPAAVRRRIGR